MMISVLVVPKDQMSMERGSEAFADCIRSMHSSSHALQMSTGMRIRANGARRQKEGTMADSEMRLDSEEGRMREFAVMLRVRGNVTNEQQDYTTAIEVRYMESNGTMVNTNSAA
mmetsp:Transcript_405/g.1126  ORF Transcript_405/g.1126 Transcript_405/m.1126 type:complete len:114 (+) Transcript_405:633-974(+)